MTRGSSIHCSYDQIQMRKLYVVACCYRIYVIFTFLIRGICILCYRRVYIGNKGTVGITRVYMCGQMGNARALIILFL